MWAWQHKKRSSTGSDEEKRVKAIYGEVRFWSDISDKWPKGSSRPVGSGYVQFCSVALYKCLCLERCHLQES